MLRLGIWEAILSLTKLLRPGSSCLLSTAFSGVTVDAGLHA